MYIYIYILCINNHEPSITITINDREASLVLPAFASAFAASAPARAAWPRAAPELRPGEAPWGDTNHGCFIGFLWI